MNYSKPLPVETKLSSSTVIALLLGALMLLTRSGHLPEYMPVADASWAVFLAAGYYLGNWQRYNYFFLLAFVIDLLVINLGSVNGACFTPGYLLLYPAYASLWLGGLYCRQAHSTQQLLRRLLPTAVLGICLAFAISNFGYFAFGNYSDPAGLLDYASRVYPWLWVFLSTTLSYLALIGLTHLLYIQYRKALPEQHKPTAP